MKLNELQRIKQLAGLNEFTDPEGQFTATSDPNDEQSPNKGFAVRVVGNFVHPGPRTFAALDLWTALERILPNDYPHADYQEQDKQNTPQKRVLQTIARQGSAIVKTGIKSRDIAETIADKFKNFRGPDDPSRPIPAEVIELDR
jgi:hypothetical protein